MIGAVCDASVLFKLVITESDTAKAEALVRSTRVFVPEFVFLEVGNGLWARVLRGDLDAAEAVRLLARLFDFRFETRPIHELLQHALNLGILMRHPIYDCAYLALAQSLGVPLVTADQRFINALRRSEVAVTDVRTLSDMA